MSELVEIPSRLQHGTTALAIADILRNGIIPRGKDAKRNNWKSTVGSNAKCVYLTDTYSFYFAQCAGEGEGDVAVIELETAVLMPNLQADEDLLEQGSRGQDNLDPSWDMKRRTIYYRSRAHLYKAELSLTHMGTCSYRGTVPPAAITRVCFVRSDRVMPLVLMAHDPFISIANHKYIGQRHKQFHRWLFGDEPECEACPTLTREGLTVYDVRDPVGRLGAAIRSCEGIDSEHSELSRAFATAADRKEAP